MDHLLIRTARGEAVERPPVWAMRQAGRWDPKFNALRQGMGFYEFSENVELSIECSLLPQRFGVDLLDGVDGGKAQLSAMLFVRAQELFHCAARSLEDPGEQWRNSSANVNTAFDGTAELRHNRSLGQINDERYYRLWFLTQFKQTFLNKRSDHAGGVPCKHVNPSLFRAALRLCGIFINKSH